MAPLNLEDIIDLMKKDKEERAKERESDKEEIRNLICSGVQEEVEKNIKPIQDRQAMMERDQADMKEKFREMVYEVRDLKSKLESPIINSQEFPAITQPAFHSSLSSGQYAGFRVQGGGGEHQGGYGTLDPKIEELIDHARRTVGLYKIDSDDLARMRQEQYGGATTEHEEKLLAVKEYLKCELKLNQDDISSMEIEDISIPTKEKDDPQSLNVTFSSFASVTRIYEKTKIMRKESRINNYIQREFKDRLAAVSDFDYNLRLDKKYQTRIKMGMQDLELHKKLRGTRKWERVSLPNNLPPVDLNRRPATPPSLSPPSGRPGHGNTREKRGRESSGSETGQNISKVAKQGKEKEDETGKEQARKDSVENDDLISEAATSAIGEKGLNPPDPGNIISIQGTPAKMLPTHDFVQSPIISGRKHFL